MATIIKNEIRNGIEESFIEIVYPECWLLDKKIAFDNTRNIVWELIIDVLTAEREVKKYLSGLGFDESYAKEIVNTFVYDPDEYYNMEGFNGEWSTIKNLACDAAASIFGTTPLELKGRIEEIWVYLSGANFKDTDIKEIIAEIFKDAQEVLDFAWEEMGGEVCA